MKNKLLFLILIMSAATPWRSVVGAENLQSPPAGYSATEEIDVRRDYPMTNFREPRRMVIAEVEFEIRGSFVHDAVTMAEQYGILIGDTITVPGPYITAAINRFVARRQFSYVDIVAEPLDDERVKLIILLESVPRVSDWRFEGIRKGQATTLTDNMGLRQAQPLSDFDINRHKNYIRRYYRDKGFRNTEVDVRIETDPRYPSLVIVTFVIDRRHRVKIEEITFSGNEEFSDRRLRRALKNTHRRSWNIFRSAKLRDEKFEEDRDVNLIDFYNSKGFRNAFVLGDEVFDINERRIGIHIDLSEGNKYFFRNISFVGNTIIPTDDLERMLGLQRGQIYDRRTLHKRLGIGPNANHDDPNTVNSFYQNHGYLTANIEPSEIIVGRDSIDLEIKIFEGRQFTVNNVTISGNEMVDDEVIRRDIFVFPGELYSQEMLMMTMRRLAGMGHFDQQSIVPGIQPVTDRLVDLSFSLTEMASDQFELSGGFGAGMFIGSVGITLNNLSTRRFRDRDAWRPYPRGQNQSLSLRAQTNGQYYKAFSASFTEPWLGGRRPISLSVGAHYSAETDAYFLFQRSDRYFRTFGISTGIGRMLRWPDPHFQLYNEVSYTRYMLEKWNYFIMSDGASNIFAFTTVLGRKTTDWDIFPSRGSNFSLSVALTPPYSLFDGKDYSDPTMPERERYKWIEYHKWKFKGDWYTPISMNNKFVLRAAVEMGYLGHYDRHKLSPFEGFDMGGSGMSGYNVYGVDIISMRGYEDGGLTPSSGIGDYARVYNKYTAELRYLIIQQQMTNIYGLAFVEGGNAFRNWKEFNPFQIKRAAGLGVRIQLPMVGMLGFDWGWGFDTQVGATKRHGSQITFTFGNQF